MAGLLTGKIALVTGAGSGIGHAVSKLFAQQGACVIAAGLQNVKEVTNTLHREGDINHLHYNVNVSNENEVSQMMEDVYQHYNTIPSIAVNCAGITKDGFMVKMKESDFDDVIDVNLKGTFFITKHLCHHLLKQKIQNASIINIASIVGKTGNIGQGNYAASKAGVVAFTKTSALEMARFGIRCNSILPGFIETAMTQKIPDKVREGFRSMIPLGRFGEPNDVAETCLFLASDKSKYITATTIEVAGGIGA